MSEPIYNFRDPSFNLTQAYYYTLLIQVEATSFSYAITYKKQLLAWEMNCSLSELADPQALYGELTASYKKVVVGLPADRFTLIPNALFSKSQVTNYARLLDVRPEERVLSQVIDKQNYIIYKLHEDVISLTEKFGLENTVYLQKGWITAAAQNSPSNLDLYLHAESGKAEFLHFKNGDIRFYNNFEYKTEDDLAYYTSVVIEELNIDAHKVRLKLSGNIKPEDKYSLRLAEFFPEVVFFNPELLELPVQIAPQQILTLAALSLCGLLEAV